MDGALGRNRNFFAGVRVAACSLLARTSGECAEASQFDPASCFQPTNDLLEKDMQDLFDLNKIQGRVFCEQLCYQFGTNHHTPLHWISMA